MQRLNWILNCDNSRGCLRRNLSWNECKSETCKGGRGGGVSFVTRKVIVVWELNCKESCFSCSTRLLLVNFFVKVVHIRFSAVASTGFQMNLSLLKPIFYWVNDWMYLSYLSLPFTSLLIWLQSRVFLRLPRNPVIVAIIFFEKSCIRCPIESLSENCLFAPGWGTGEN